MSESRQLAAIMFTDIAGYTSLMGEDERQAFELLKKNRSIQRPIIEKFNGRWIKEIGDGVLASFSTVSDAVYCAATIQKTCEDHPDLNLRIGIHLGEVVFEGNDVFGDGVNIASRLEPLAPVGGILVSESVHRNLGNKKDIESTFIREEQLRNVREPIKVYSVQADGVEPIIIPKSSGNGRNLSSKSAKPMRLAFIIVGALIILLSSYYLYSSFNFQGTSYNSDNAINKSIAVLPFDVIGGDPEGEYFAEGVRGEIYNHLNLIKDLNVKGKSVVDRLEASTSTAQDLVDELGLTHYLECSAYKVGNEIRITAQLVDAVTNDQIWAEKYDRSYDNLLSTQSEIAKKVADALQVSISPEVIRLIDKEPTNNSQAWDNYLQGEHYWRKYAAIRKPQDLKNMVQFLKAAIKSDTTFALAYSRLAMAYLQVPGDPEIVFEFINVDSALILCNRAIALDPSLADPYLRRAQYYNNIIGDTSKAVQDFKKAISIDPEAPEPYLRYGIFRVVNYWDVATDLKLVFQGIQKQPDTWLLARMLREVGNVYLEVGLYQRAEDYFNKALVYYPDDIRLIQRKVQLYWLNGQFDRALETIQQIIAISPLNLGLLLLGLHYTYNGDYAESVRYFDEYYTKASETATGSSMHQNDKYAYSLMKLGRLQEANEKFQVSLDNIKYAQTPHYKYAQIYSAKGMLDSAYYHLEKAVAGPILWGFSDFMEFDPLFENIKDQPEFKRLEAIAKEKVRIKREEVLHLEETGEIPSSLEELEL